MPTAAKVFAIFMIALLSAGASKRRTTDPYLWERELLFCANSSDLSELPPLNRTVSSALTILYCPPPKFTYAVELQALNIDIAALTTLKIYGLPSQPPLRDEHFAGLKLRHLIIEPYSNDGPDISLSYDFSASDDLSNVDLSEGSNYMTITCNIDYKLYLPKLIPNRSATVKDIRITTCPPPSKSYKAIFQALDIVADAVEKLHIFKITNSTSLQAAHFTGLTLEELTIGGLSASHQFNADVFNLLDTMATLKKLNIQRVLSPPLPESSQLIEIQLLDGAHYGAFGGCTELRHLSIELWQVPELEGGWLGHCPQLKELELNHLSEPSMQHALAGVRKVSLLTIYNCRIDNLSDKLLADAVELQKLRIYGHRLIFVHWNAFKSQSRLEDLSMEDNQLSEIEDLVHALQPVQTLRNLSLEDNPKVDFCDMAQAKNSFLSSLERLNLGKTGLTRLCFRDMQGLSYLNLSNNEITNLEFQELPSPLEHSLDVDLSGNSIQDFPRSKKDYHDMVVKLKQVHKVTVQLELSLDCDCKQAWFARALRLLSHLTVAGARCLSSGERLDREPPERLECKKYKCERCMCRTAWADNATDADCRGAHMCTMPNLTYVPNLRKFLAPENVIKPLRAQDFALTLMEVDLRFNHISYVDAEAVGALFAAAGRAVWLSGNPLVCDCENQPLIAALHAHRAQVADYENVTCIGEGRLPDALPVSGVLVSGLCAAARQRSLLLLSAAGGALLALAALAAALYRCYGRELRIFLYARGWCTCCVREEHLDAERPYDAFISFAHEDDEFVATELLPALEARFQLCVHTRDWVPGEMIATQIVRSVERSRRTVVVLSRSFARSVWGLMEFRTAHVSALREGCVRLVVVVLDDVLRDSTLDAELRRYLRTNTYLRWGDPAFWERLMYALPHRRAWPPCKPPALMAQPAPTQPTEMLSYRRPATELYSL